MGRCRLGGRQRREGWDQACGRRSSWGREPWSSGACASVSCMNPQLHSNSSVRSGRSSSLWLTSTSLKFALLSAFVGPHPQGRDGLDHPLEPLELGWLRFKPASSTRVDPLSHFTSCAPGFMLQRIWWEWLYVVSKSAVVIYHFHYKWQKY